VGNYKKNVFSDVPQFILMDTAKAARVILRDVARNRAIIVFPFHARFLWWLHRMSPSVTGFVARIMTEGNRRYRVER
jgi:hypothetical protein